MAFLSRTEWEQSQQNKVEMLHGKVRATENCERKAIIFPFAQWSTNDGVCVVIVRGVPRYWRSGATLSEFLAAVIHVI